MQIDHYTKIFQITMITNIVQIIIMLKQMIVPNLERHSKKIIDSKKIILKLIKMIEGRRRRRRKRMKKERMEDDFFLYFFCVVWISKRIDFIFSKYFFFDKKHNTLYHWSVYFFVLYTFCEQSMHQKHSLEFRNSFFFFISSLDSKYDLYSIIISIGQSIK